MAERLKTSGVEAEVRNETFLMTLMSSATKVVIGAHAAKVDSGFTCPSGTYNVAMVAKNFNRAVSWRFCLFALRSAIHHDCCIIGYLYFIVIIICVFKLLLKLTYLIINYFHLQVIACVPSFKFTTREECCSEMVSFVSRDDVLELLDVETLGHRSMFRTGLCDLLSLKRRKVDFEGILTRVAPLNLWFQYFLPFIPDVCQCFLGNQRHHSIRGEAPVCRGASPEPPLRLRTCHFRRDHRQQCLVSCHISCRILPVRI